MPLYANPPAILPAIPPIVAPSSKDPPRASEIYPPAIPPTPCPIKPAPIPAKGVKHKATPATIDNPDEIKLAWPGRLGIYGCYI